jgi:hypothetical protein
MNKKLLTVLGCSSSVAMTLLSGGAAEAKPTREYVFKAPGIEDEFVKVPARETDYPFYDCSCSEYDPAAMEASDRQGDRAISLYGCDCAGCRNLVRSLDKGEKVSWQNQGHSSIDVR